MSGVDLILRNARVITMAVSQPLAGAVAIAGGRFVAVGDDAAISALAGPHTAVVDCAGNTLVPGLEDAHCHLLGFLDSLIGVDCRPPRVGAIPDLQRAIRQRAATTPPGQWIRAAGYDEFHLAERRHPTRWDLDAAAPHHPVRLQHRSRHICVLNTVALRLAGIDRNTSDPLGGVIERDEETAEPTGVLHEMNAFVGRHVVPKLTAVELDQGFRLVTADYLRRGFTSVQDATVRNGLEEWQLLDRQVRSHALGLRVRVMLGLDHLASVANEPAVLRGRDDRPDPSAQGALLGALKVVVDESAGYLWPPEDDLRHLVLEAHAAGHQVAIHATTPASVQAAVGAVEEAVAQIPRPDHRHRVEHCAWCPPDVLWRLRRARLAVASQPAFLFYSGDRYRDEYSPEALASFYPFRALLDGGVPVAGSTDSPVASNDPFVAMYAAVTRRSAGGAAVPGPDQVLSPAQALWIFTAGGAYVSFAENDKGSIAPGKLADAALLDHDPLTSPVDLLPQTSCLLTVLGGRIVWTADARFAPTILA